MAKMNNKKVGAEGQTSGAGHCEDGSSLEPPELFCSLGSLIVEGRLPAPPGGGGRGYTEGPHVELPGRISRHKCSQTEYLCNKNENFRKHMLLLWQNNVPMSIEILLCSDCRVGEAKARSLEVTTVPEPGSILLEQWTVACVTRGEPGAGAEVTGLSLLQAVRSYLHFSQLSAWYSKTAGTKPWNVLIRITIPGQEFASKFSQPAEEHLFPVASAGAGAALSVSVRSLPRTEDIPTVICSHNQAVKIKGAAEVIKGAAPDTEEAEEAKLGIAGALAWREGGDLRRSLVKSKLAASDLDCPGYGRLTKSDSMDSMLGDSLLDPPPSLAKMTPRRYQSPSRCGSPSLEAPEPLMGLRGQPQPPSYDQAMAMRGAEAECPDMARLNRHDLLRRRDLSLFHGLHPRLFQNQQRLSLPPKPAQQPGPRPPPTSLPCRAVTPGHQPPMVTADTLPVRCTISGKHICQFEEEVVEHHTVERRISPDLGTSPQPSGSHYRQGELGAKAKGWSSRLGRTSTPYSRDSSSDSSSTSKEPPRSSKEPLCHEEMEDVLAYLKTRRSPLSSSKERNETSRDDLLSCKSSRRPSFEELRPSSSITQVYRTELSNNNNNFVQVNQKPDKTNLFLEAILRPQLTDSKIAPGIHSLRETSKYCSQSGDSSNDASPLTPVHHHDHDHDQIISEEENNNNVDQIIPGCDPHPWLSGSPDDIRQEGQDDVSVGDLCQDLQSKCLITKKGGGVVKRSLSPLSDLNVRVRSLSENCHNIGGGHQAPEARVRPTLQPLDFSFEECEDSWSVTHDEVGSSETSFVVGDKRRKSIDEEDGVPSANKKNAFRKSFDSAASMVFQRRTGLPLTSSPAPMRRGIKFDFDSGISTPKDIKRALFEPQSPEESECGSPKKKKRDPRKLLSTSAPATISNNNLLCNFEESVLNGRLEPVSTVEGFTAEIGASGSFQPKHLTFPVTVFFYTLCENSNYASPYLGHINLGKKGYRIPDRGTIQLTLFNPLGTVVKMFVVMYDLTDMPPNSQTFLRQRTLYMPHDKTDSDPDAQKWLRYLIHLRVASSKSGKIYLHTDVRMIIFRKSDLDTATDHENGKGWELRSFTRSPSNPKFSPRK